MTSIGVTNRTGAYNRPTEAHDWKRRGERLVRASGLPYTIVRPGWFDYNKPRRAPARLAAGRHAPGRQSERRRRRATPDRRGPGRSLTSPQAAAQDVRAGRRRRRRRRPDFEPLFAALDADPPGALDAVHDTANMPLDKEPQRVRDDLGKKDSDAISLYPGFFPDTQISEGFGGFWRFRSGLNR